MKREMSQDRSIALDQTILERADIRIIISFPW